MNCISCCHVCQAGNPNLVGCAYWTAIFQKRKLALQDALTKINRREGFRINLESHLLEKEAIDFLIDVLIEDYAPMPMFQGWANLNGTSVPGMTMTADCVVLEPKGGCAFFENYASVAHQDQANAHPGMSKGH
jgi:hypothetical protein